MFSKKQVVQFSFVLFRQRLLLPTGILPLEKLHVMADLMIEDV
jgi:hypothetical protein